MCTCHPHDANGACPSGFGLILVVLIDVQLVMSADVVDVALGGVGREADGSARQTGRRPDPIADHPQEGVDGIGNVDANSTRTSKPILNFIKEKSSYILWQYISSECHPAMIKTYFSTFFPAFLKKSVATLGQTNGLTVTEVLLLAVRFVLDPFLDSIDGTTIWSASGTLKSSPVVSSGPAL